MMHSSLPELKSAFRGFKHHAPIASRDRYCCLDTFYAVECGLKALLIIQKGAYSTADMDSSYMTHDLHRLISSCRNIEAVSLSSAVTICGDVMGQSSIAFCKFHEILRYGIRIRDDEYRRHADKLNVLYEVVKRCLDRE